MRTWWCIWYFAHLKQTLFYEAEILSTIFNPWWDVFAVEFFFLCWGTGELRRDCSDAWELVLQSPVYFDGKDSDHAGCQCHHGKWDGLLEAFVAGISVGGDFGIQ